MVDKFQILSNYINKKQDGRFSKFHMNNCSYYKWFMDVSEKQKIDRLLNFSISVIFMTRTIQMHAGEKVALVWAYM